MIERPLTDDHLKGIGRISVNFNRLEFLMKLCVNFLLAVDQDFGLIATSVLDFQKLTTVLDQLYKSRNITKPTRLEKWSDILKRIDVARDKRNAVLHSDWSLEEEGDDATGIKFPRGRSKWFAPNILKAGPADFEQIAVEIRQVSDKVGELLVEVSGGIEGTPNSREEK